MNQLGYHSEYIPNTIQKEFLIRWKKVTKISFEDFFKLIEQDSSLYGWYNNPTHILECYYSFYIEGYIGQRYPKLPISPEDVLKNLIKEVDEILLTNYPIQLKIP